MFWVMIEARVLFIVFALDHPERINKLGIIEIVPTADFWASWTADLAIGGLSLDIFGSTCSAT